MHPQNKSLKVESLPTKVGSWILVVTPQPKLGDIISESLKDSLLAEHTSKASSAVMAMRRHPECKYAILDMEMGELNILELGYQLRKINPGIELILISNNEPPTDFDDLLPWKFLRKPFVKQDIRAALGISKSTSDFSTSEFDHARVNQDHMRWSDNPGLATQYLERMIEKSFAQEVLIIHDQDIWSCAGKLSEESVQELKSTINRSFAGGDQSDLTRYVTLETSRTEHALYASILAIGLILAMVFDPDIPFGVVRRQTKELANTLLLLDDGRSQNGPLPDALANLQREAVAQAMAVSNEIYDDENVLQLKRISDVIENPPSPDPVNKRWTIAPNDPIFPVDLPKPERPFVLDLDEQSDRDLFNDLENASRKSDWERERFEDTFGDTRPTLTKRPAHQISGKDSNLIDLPSPDHQSQINSLNEFIPDALYKLTYTFLLIPRFSTHNLKSSETQSIKEYIKNFHLSYGWRLEMLDMQPNYLRWVSSFPPNIAPSSHLEMIRMGTSRQLFDEFPDYKKENVSGDYWAPGYIIIEGKNSISPQLVSDYIEQNRKKHGITVD
jgi:putative transposase